MKLLFRQSCTAFQVIVAVMAFSATAHATIFSFNADPFAGTDVLTTPGRQVVGNERFINFSIASDVYSFDRTAFGIQTIQFANDVVGNLPTEGANVIVLQTFDSDNDPTTPFNAGIAANLIAEQVTSPGPGFFVYFNSGLDRARLVSDRSERKHFRPQNHCPYAEPQRSSRS
jgi:hypothetical protein